MKSSVSRPVVSFDEGGATRHADVLIAEEPLELRLVHGGDEHPLSVTMRTPGHDDDLVLGLLYAERVIAGVSDVLELQAWNDGHAVQENVLRVRLRSGQAALTALSRRTFTSSACGVCGTGSIERLAVRTAPAAWSAAPLSPELVCAFPLRLRERQELFRATGALHGAALFTAAGECLVVREDVGRHNAVDKVVGWALRHAALPLQDHVLAVSGRVGFEIAQKAAVAGIPVICAVSAPSSLAVSVAESFGITLVGFIRGRRFNVYTEPERIALPLAAPSVAPA